MGRSFLSSLLKANHNTGADAGDEQRTATTAPLSPYTAPQLLEMHTELGLEGNILLVLVVVEEVSTATCDNLVELDSQLRDFSGVSAPVGDATLVVSEDFIQMSLVCGKSIFDHRNPDHCPSAAISSSGLRTLPHVWRDKDRSLTPGQITGAKFSQAVRQFVCQSRCVLLRIQHTLTW